MHGMLDDIDRFVRLSRVNKSIKQVHLYPYALKVHNQSGYPFEWKEFGQAIGNLQALERLIIYPINQAEGNEEDLPTPGWEILARILSHVRQKVKIIIDEDDDILWDIEEVQALARAIRGRPAITCFVAGGLFPDESLDSLYSALATLPALESLLLYSSGHQAQPEDETTLAHPKSLTELLRVPSLRAVCFNSFKFTPALCRATANAFMEGTAVTTLDFSRCSFLDEECAAMMANGLGRNTSVSRINVASPIDQTLYSALATALPANSTIRCLSFRGNSGPGLPPIFLALEKNRCLKSLKVDVLGSRDSLCTAMQNGLGMNETLESLEISRVLLCDDNADFWCRTFSFLRLNKFLKSLVVNVSAFEKSCLIAFCLDIATMLQENTSLESICICNRMSAEIKAEDYAALFTVLHHNKTLKTVILQSDSTILLTDDEDQQIAALLKKNYEMENLPDIDLENEASNLGAILRLNAAGRRYLIQDGSSISKGVAVLSMVTSDINCVFMHLLENPRLCDRRAVEKVSAGESNASSTSPTATSGGGKREQ